jgi:hypothetical protein
MVYRVIFSRKEGDFEKNRVLEHLAAKFYSMVSQSGIKSLNRLKLLCTLRYLAGGAHWDICFGFKIGFGSFFHHGVWPIMEAIDKKHTKLVLMQTIERKCRRWQKNSLPYILILSKYLMVQS